MKQKTLKIKNICGNTTVSNICISLSIYTLLYILLRCFLQREMRLIFQKQAEMFVSGFFRFRSYDLVKMISNLLSFQAYSSMTNEITKNLVYISK